jgi:hypothetical protein
LLALFPGSSTAPSYAFMSGHNGLYFALLRYDAQQVLERQSVQVCELPRALLARFSFAELQQAVLSLAADIPPAALRDVATYCEEASLLRTRPKGSRDAVHFLGRALEVRDPLLCCMFMPLHTSNA